MYGYALQLRTGHQSASRSCSCIQLRAYAELLRLLGILEPFSNSDDVGTRREPYPAATHVLTSKSEFIHDPQTLVVMNWYQQVIETNGERTCVSVRNEEEPRKVTQCTFDRVLGPESSQEEVFLEIAPALETVVEGFNACILAYGHTGSGKTHTLIGEFADQG